MHISIGGNGGIQVTGAGSSPAEQAQYDAAVEQLRALLDEGMRERGVYPAWERKPHTNGMVYPEGWRLSPNIGAADIAKVSAFVTVIGKDLVKMIEETKRRRTRTGRFAMSDAVRSMLMNLVEAKAAADDFYYSTLECDPGAGVHVFRITSEDHPLCGKTFRLTLTEEPADE